MKFCNDRSPSSLSSRCYYTNRRVSFQRVKSSSTQQVISLREQMTNSGTPFLNLRVQNTNGYYSIHCHGLRANIIKLQQVADTRLHELATRARMWRWKMDFRLRTYIYLSGWRRKNNSRNSKHLTYILLVRKTARSTPADLYFWRGRRQVICMCCLSVADWIHWVNWGLNVCGGSQ